MDCDENNIITENERAASFWHEWAWYLLAKQLPIVSYGQFCVIFIILKLKTYYTEDFFLKFIRKLYLV